MNVEEASPDRFIPLPSGYETRCQFLAQYGKLEVFHFDPYSMALTKLNVLLQKISQTCWHSSNIIG